MNEKTFLIYGIIGVALVAVAVYFIYLRPRKAKQDAKARPGAEVPNLAVKGVPNKFPFDYISPNGLPVGSTVEISAFFKPFVFKALEYGILNQIKATTAKFGWTKARELKNYCVLLIEPHGENADGTPFLTVGGWQSAGTVIGLGGEYPIFAIVLPHQGSIGWKYLVYLLFSAWNESEHFAEFANDIAEAQKYTNGVDDHQHHPLTEGVLMVEEIAPARGFKSAKPIVAPCHFALPPTRAKGFRAAATNIKVPAGTESNSALTSHFPATK